MLMAFRYFPFEPDTKRFKSGLCIVVRTVSALSLFYSSPPYKAYCLFPPRLLLLFPRAPSGSFSVVDLWRFKVISLFCVLQTGVVVFFFFFLVWVVVCLEGGCTLTFLRPEFQNLLFSGHMIFFFVSALLSSVNPLFTYPFDVFPPLAMRYHRSGVFFLLALHLFSTPFPSPR